MFRNLVLMPSAQSVLGSHFEHGQRGLKERWEDILKVWGFEGYIRTRKTRMPSRYYVGRATNSQNRSSAKNWGLEARFVRTGRSQTRGFLRIGAASLSILEMHGNSSGSCWV